MNKRVEFSEQAQADLAGLDPSVALRIVAAINRFASTGAGNVHSLRGIHPPEFRLASAIGGSVSTTTASGWMFCACGIGGTRTDRGRPAPLRSLP